MTISLPKSYQGKPLTSLDFKNKLAEVVSKYPQGTTLAVIAKDMGPEHDTPEGRRFLTRDLKRLVQHGALRYERRLYYVSQKLYSQGVTKQDQWDRMTLHAIKALGGVVRASEVVWDMLSDSSVPHRHRPRTRRTYTPAFMFETDTLTKNIENETGHRQLYKALLRLVESGRLRRDYALPLYLDTAKRADGWYNLPPEALQGCCLTGIAYQHMLTFLPPYGWKDRLLDPEDAIQKREVETLLDSYLAQVARALNTARRFRKLAIAEVLADEAVHRSLRPWGRDCSAILSRYRANNPDYDEAKVWAELYGQFEGFTGLDWDKDVYYSRRPNMHVSPEFFYAFGKLTRFDPVALSRGTLVVVDSPQAVIRGYGRWDDVL